MMIERLTWLKRRTEDKNPKCQETQNPKPVHESEVK
jgi:hypothetical protein